MKEKSEGEGEVKRKGGGMWVVGKKKERKNKKEMKKWCRWVVGKKGKKKKKEKLINNIMIKTKFKNQNYVPNTIFFFFFFLNCDFSCKTKTMYQTNFFLQS
jgi:hypothetical protein